MDLFDFSGIYERMYVAGGYEDTRLIHVGDIRGTNGYLDDDAKTEIARRMRKANVTQHGVHLIDNGNHHYMSALMTEMVEEDFALLLLDHHPDLQPPAFGDLLSCGGWVLHALLHEPHMKCAVLAGVDAALYEEACVTLCQTVPPHVFKDLSGRLRYLPREEWTPGGVLAALADGAEEKNQNETGDKRKLPVYISVDKDVLSREEVCTTWDQGTMRTQECTAILHAAWACHRVIGIDICGEPPPDATDAEVIRSREINEALSACVL